MFNFVRRALYWLNGALFFALYAVPAGEQRAAAASALILGLFVQLVYRAESTGQLVQ
ncbi:MAG: hypothetical protein LBT92_01100 [Rickettsiales bacterium]|jgi:hypothetical protein|nr:hypothetical protein [Rickettsiales bacterium]